MLKYQEIAKKIFLYIQDSHLKQGDKLPSLTDLVNIYPASKTTILKALAELERDGFIYQVQGSGTFVRNIPSDEYINFDLNHGWTNDFTKKNTDNTDVHVTKMMPSLDIAKKLHSAISTPVFKVQRIKSLNNKVFCYETSYYNSKFVPFLNEAIAKDSLFSYIKQAYNISVGFSDKYFCVRNFSSEETAKLGLPTNSCGLSVHETFYSTGGDVFDYSENIYHPDNAKFHL